MTASIRLLPYSITDGPHNMAADEVLLEAAQIGVASLRLYGWDPATLSLGYFQRSEERLRDPHLAGMAWVRRATGGGAIIHDGDVTYAIALPHGMLRNRTPADWHSRIHHALAELLQRQHMPVQVVGGQRLEPSKMEFLCFAVPQPGDVVVEGRKVVGGAQRLRAGALLQHGSMQLPLGAMPADDFSLKLAAALGWDAHAEDWTPTEDRRIEKLAVEKYGQDWWNRKR